jgi:hypothetical protein
MCGPKIATKNCGYFSKFFITSSSTWLQLFLELLKLMIRVVEFGPNELIVVGTLLIDCNKKLFPFTICSSIASSFLFFFFFVENFQIFQKCPKNNLNTNNQTIYAVVLRVHPSIPGSSMGAPR